MMISTICTFLNTYADAPSDTKLKNEVQGELRDQQFVKLIRDIKVKLDDEDF